MCRFSEILRASSSVQPHGQGVIRSHAEPAGEASPAAQPYAALSRDPSRGRDALREMEEVIRVPCPLDLHQPLQVLAVVGAGQLA